MAQHRSANGKIVDMAALRARHENTRAVGNMNVNARGDILDPNNNVINDVGQRVNRMYRKTTQTRPNSQIQPDPAPVAPPPAAELNEFERELEADDFVPKKDPEPAPPVSATGAKKSEKPARRS